jgi:hypothetical protein
MTSSNDSMTIPPQAILVVLKPKNSLSVITGGLG